MQPDVDDGLGWTWIDLLIIVVCRLQGTSIIVFLPHALNATALIGAWTVRSCTHPHTHAIEIMQSRKAVGDRWLFPFTDSSLHDRKES